MPKYTKTQFAVEDFDSGDKEIHITETKGDPYLGLRISIDYDDVDHQTVREKVEKLLNILNLHW